MANGSMQQAVAASAAYLAELDYDKMREVARAVHDNPDLLAAFERDPEGTAKSINGFEPPAGFHIHIADENNTLYPAEEHGVFGNDSASAWSRLEVRAGYKTISLVACCTPA